MRVGLLRHGEVEGGNRFRGSTDDPLSRTGLSQMQAATAATHWDRVISSPLQRCTEFADLYARQNTLLYSLEPRLQEIHFGSWENRSAAELMEETPEALTRFWHDPLTYTPPGGESLSHFQARVLEAWHEILTAHAQQDVLIVTHGGVIRTLLCHILKRPLASLLELRVEHGSLHLFLIDSAGTVIPDDETLPRL
ncbi:MAG: alpha-ribazole phosphatase [Gammaproteobacteria bacterium]|nr:alpha-ribazole phosphatase [Gammaproteobacteria bacterium]